MLAATSWSPATGGGSAGGRVLATSLGRRRRLGERVGRLRAVGRDEAGLYQVLEVMPIGLTAQLLPVVVHVLEHVGGPPALADDVADGGRHHHDLHRRHPRLLVLLRE